jgi:hypothetical protein
LHGAFSAKNGRTCDRFSCAFFTALPNASAQCAEKLDFAISRPMVVMLFMVDGSLDVFLNRTIMARFDAESGRRPPHHRNSDGKVSLHGDQVAMAPYGRVWLT